MDRCFAQKTFILSDMCNPVKSHHKLQPATEVVVKRYQSVMTV